ncbi:MAG: hypothetical protein ACYTEQ_01445 [Planctomycetota bacterium]|jgi:hypothetical protein
MSGLLGEDFLYGEDAASFANAPQESAAGDKKQDKNKILTTALATAAAGLLGGDGPLPYAPQGMSVGAASPVQIQAPQPGQPGIDPYILARLLRGG